MKRIFALLCMFALVFSMDLEISQVSIGYYEYKVKELNAVNTSLQIVVMKDGKQFYVEDIAKYDGLHKGSLALRQPGQYLISAINPQTGASAEAGLIVSSPVLSEEFQENFSAGQEEAIQEKISIPAEELIPGLPFIIVGISVILIALLVFGNPLKRK